MQVEIEALALAVDIDPETENRIDKFEQEQRDDGVVDHGAGDAVELDDDLLRIAVDKTALAVAADRGHRENAGEDGADRAADAMHAKRIETVIIAEGMLEP